MAEGLFKLLNIHDIRPIITGTVAARALQEDGYVSKWTVHAFTSIERRARRHFIPTILSVAALDQLRAIDLQTAYWHGTGRYHWHEGSTVDILKTILAAGALEPHLDKYDPRLGSEAVSSISLATVRLYARSYADMHHVNPEKLNRYIDASHAVSYFVLRPYVRHRYADAKAHPDGLWAGRKAQHAADQARLKQVGHYWTEKIRTTRVNPLLAFRAGSDIPGNYGIIIGLDDTVRLSTDHTAFIETREVRSDAAISLEHVTHVEVPAAEKQEVERLVKSTPYQFPVVSTEDMESYSAQLPIQTVLGT